jgi:hypothetical protein
MPAFNFGDVKRAADQEEAGYRVAITDENGVPYDPPFVITVAGFNSKRARSAQSRNHVVYIDRVAAAKDDPEQVLEARSSTISEGSVEVAARSTLGWEGLTEDGVEIAFSLTAARQLYTKAPDIHAQVLRAMRSREAAFRGAGAVADGVDGASGDDGAARGEEDNTGAPAIARGARGRKKSSGAETA